MTPIYTKSPINNFKVLIGQIDQLSRTAVFFITDKRIFVEANAFGIDSDVFERKSIRWCNNYVFKFDDGHKITLTQDEFIQNAWLYPPKNDPNYKAPADTFQPKLVITGEKAQDIIKNRKPPSEREQYLISQGIVY